MQIEILAAIVTVTVLVAVVAIRTATNGRVEIKLNDAVIAAIAAGLTLLMSGFITKLAVSTSGVTIETAKEAILSASARPIDKQVSALPVAPFEEVLKGGLDMLPQFVQRRVQGIDFLLGEGGYVPDVVQKYLETLSQYSFFRGMVLMSPDHKLIATIDGRSLLAALQTGASPMGYEQITQALNRGASEDLAALSKLPGFVPAQDAATAQSDKRDVLAKMEKAAVDWWPVVNADGQLAGIVERSRLISSLILDVTEQLSQGTAAAK